jgi:probable HAF family extracellular repeat protein
MSGMKRLLIALLVIASALTARASDTTLLIEFEPRTRLFAASVSGTGAVVAGTLDGGGGFYWMPTTGVISIGGLQADAVSRDGRTIVGAAVDSRLVRQAAIWKRAAEWQLLGSFPNAVACDRDLSSAYGTSRDGRVVVGLAWNGCTFAHAFKWQESTGVVDLGSTVAGHPSLAAGVSADGRVAVGYQERADGTRQGARWVDLQQQLIPNVAGALAFVGTANATNHDGSIVVGRLCRFGVESEQSAWVWSERDGTRCLPAPTLRPSPGPVIQVTANGTSDDGRVIGGGQNVGGSNDSNAIIWINGTGSYLKDYLQANGVPNAFQTWINTGEITDVSPDGRILVGWGAAPGGFRGYMVILGDQP